MFVQLHSCWHWGVAESFNGKCRVERKYRSQSERHWQQTTSILHCIKYRDTEIKFAARTRDEILREKKHFRVSEQSKHPSLGLWSQCQRLANQLRIWRLMTESLNEPYPSSSTHWFSTEGSLHSLMSALQRQTQYQQTYIKDYTTLIWHVVFY